MIDADNASAKTIDDVLSAIERMGHIATKKIYGDWSMSGLTASWQEAILRHAIDPMQQFAYVKGKNATDIALVIEAMDLLHSGEYDGFCLVSSDSDFASLAVRIRKNGIKVLGFGRKEAVISFRQACDEFFEVEGLAKPKTAQLSDTSQKDVWDNKKLKSDTKLLNALRESVIKNIKDEWANYSQIVSYFNKHHANIDIKKYGYKKLIELYQVIDLFSVNTNKENKQLIVKLKENPPTKKDEGVQSNVIANQKYTSEQLKSDKLLITTIQGLIANNPKKDSDWVNISYIASELNKNPDIDLNKYGYKKFSDLMTAIRLFDIKKQPNGMYIKLKQPKNDLTLQNEVQTTLSINETTQKPLTLSDLSQNPLILNGKINIYLYRPSGIDSVVWRLGENKKVRHEGDFVFYGQTQSNDNTIELDNNDIRDLFTCHLSTQTKDIHQLVFSVSHESDVMTNDPIRIVIAQNGKQLLTHEFMGNDDISKSAILFSLNRVDHGWRFVPRSQFVRHDLRALCHAFGIEVED